MPNCDFFAFGDDHRVILKQVFEVMPCRIFELSSRRRAGLAEFKCIADFERHFSITNWSLGQHSTLHLQIYADGAGGLLNLPLLAPRMEAHNLETDHPTCCHKPEGWGLIQLYLESPHHDYLRESHTNHNSEKRANTWSPHYPSLGDPDDWNWNVVNSFSRKLNRFIRKCAVDKKGSRAILPCAADYMATL